MDDLIKQELERIRTQNQRIIREHNFNMLLVLALAFIIVLTYTSKINNGILMLIYLALLILALFDRSVMFQKEQKKYSSIYTKMKNTFKK